MVNSIFEIGVFLKNLTKIFVYVKMHNLVNKNEECAGCLGVHLLVGSKAKFC